MQLPLLPSTYPSFSWEASNGSATAEQTVAAYKAITEKGSCVNFSRLVWNDIIDCLANALTAAGLSWDGTYTTADAAKINTRMGELTAAAFNSVRHNIDRLINSTWLWACNPAVAGYTGRLDFRGYQRWGDSSDKVYGWYIEDLVAMINLLIGILRNDANMARLPGTVNIRSVNDIALLDSPAGFLVVQRSSHFTPSVSLLDAPAGFLATDSIFTTGTAAALVPHSAGFLVTDSVITTAAHADLVRHDSGLFIRRAREQSRHEAELDAHRAGYAAVIHKSATRHTARIIFHNGHYVGAALLSLSQAVAALDRCLSAVLAAVGTARSGSVSEMLCADPSRLTAAHIAITGERATVAAYPAQFAAGSFRAYTDHTATGSAHKAAQQAAFRRSVTNGTHTVFPGAAGIAAAHRRSATQYQAPATAHKAGQAASTHIDHTAMTGKVVAGIGQGMGAVARSSSRDAVTVIAGIPHSVAFAEPSQSHTTAAMSAAGGGELGAALSPQTKHTARLQAPTAGYTLVAGLSVSALRAFLTLQGVEPSWYDPVKNGSDLYIRSVWLSYQDRDQAFIDTDVWYETIREGNNLYIRSAWSSYQDRDQAFVDTAVWYEAIRNGGDLYLRSVWSNYQDRTEVGIDTPAWYPPIQEDGDLYIRQDIIGGA